MDYLRQIFLAAWQYITGPTGALGFTLAIVIVGVLCFSGKVPVKWFVILVAAACLIFGSKWVATTFFQVSF
ncbi:TrbC/VirB2 family protein [Allofrancisella guangzhouensis]|uniref:TrbC/VirB2 family protein n=1 Tax=Allofrancisella guangzhouensis TaxID=594679 RepID=UPI001907B05C|nr:TrbC/VirB2 family protein [Allofrancisella guangzhouensis]MBK2046061.1 TrbC/VirB2 family protein [Allofrancisella guangzhouensis]